MAKHVQEISRTVAMPEDNWAEATLTTGATFQINNVMSSCNFVYK